MTKSTFSKKYAHLKKHTVTFPKLNMSCNWLPRLFTPSCKIFFLLKAQICAACSCVFKLLQQSFHAKPQIFNCCAINVCPLEITILKCWNMTMNENSQFISSWVISTFNILSLITATELHMNYSKSLWKQKKIPDDDSMAFHILI